MGKRPPLLHLYLVFLGFFLLVSTDIGQYRSLLGSSEELLQLAEDSDTRTHRHHIRSALDSLGLTTESVLSDKDASIRSWGCNITATPFLFVHIGKAGGGNVRRRIASAALNVTRNASSWREARLDNHYYPVLSGNGTFHRAKFCTTRDPSTLPFAEDCSRIGSTT